MQIGYIRSTRRTSQEHAPDVDTRQQCAPQGRRKSHALDVACSVTVSIVNKTRSARIISSADDRGHTISCSSHTGEGKEVQITARSGSCLKFGVEVEELLVLLLRNSLWRERSCKLHLAGNLSFSFYSLFPPPPMSSACFAFTSLHTGVWLGGVEASKTGFCLTHTTLSDLQSQKVHARKGWH